MESSATERGLHPPAGRVAPSRALPLHPRSRSLLRLCCIGGPSDGDIMGGLNSDVLVLNRLWQAVNVVAARRALTLLYVGRSKVVATDFTTCDWQRWLDGDPGAGDEVVDGVSMRIRVPRVIQLLDFDRVPRPRVKFTRANVYLRDGHRCQYCGRHASERELTLDHVHPRSRGGRTTWRNIVVSCVGCNAQKRDRRPEEAGMRLLRKPRQPRWHPATALRPVQEPHPDWLPFLGGFGTGTTWMEEGRRAVG